MNTLAKGNRWRRRCEVWLQGLGFVTTPRGLGYAGDDITADRDDLALSIEAKHHNKITLAAFVDQAVDNAGDRIPVVIVHRKGRAEVDDAYVVIPGSQFRRLISRL